MRRLLFPVLAFLTLIAIPAMAQDQDQLQGLPPRAAPTAHIQVQQLAVVDATPNFDAARTTTAYLAQVNGAARAKSDAYFEGGYWLMAVDLLWTLVVTGLLLWLGISSAIRDWAAERTHSRTTQAMIYGVAYVAIMAAAQFPLSVYEGFFREHSYGLSNQDFMAWLGDQGTSLARKLVAVGRRSGDPVPDRDRGDLSPLHRAFVQSLFALAGQPAQGADPFCGARQ